MSLKDIKNNFVNFFTPSDDEAYGDEQVDAAVEIEIEEKPRRASKAAERPANVTGMNNGKPAQLQVVLVKPEHFEDGLAIADHLCARRTVIVNVERAQKDVIRRLVDFLSGVAYANKGSIKRAANNTYVVTPNNVDVMGDILFDEQDTSGTF